MEKKACIYHFSANPDSKVCKRHIKEITEHAVPKGFKVEKVYIDSSLKQSEKTAHIEMLNDANKYDCLFVRDIFHLNKWSVAAMGYVKELQDKDVEVYSLNSGKVMLTSSTSEFMKPYKVLFYHSKVSMADERKYETQKSIVELFCREKTNWTIVECIYEENDKKTVNGQPKLWSLGDVSDKYDLVVVQSFSRLDLRTARLEKIIKQLNTPVYSMQEGLLTIKRKE